MAKLGLLIFNGCSFSLFKYILVSVERASQYLITVCFGLKLLIMKHLKGRCAEQLGSSYHRGSSENRSTPSPWGYLGLHGAAPPASPRGASPVPIEAVSSQLCPVSIRNIPLEMGSCCKLALLLRPQPMVVRQVGRAEPPAQQSTVWGRWLHPVPNPCPWGVADALAAPGLAHRRQLARRSHRFLQP